MRAVNLIPSDSRSGSAPAPARSGGAAYAVLTVLGGLVILAFLYGLAHHQSSTRRAKVASLAVETEKANAGAAQLTPYTSFVALREQRTQAVTQLVDSRFDWAHAFHELGRVLPNDVSITALDGTIGATTTAGATSTSSTPPATSTGAAASAASSSTPPGSVPTFNLSGCATSQAEVAVALGRLRLIDGVHEVNLQSSTKGSGGGAAGASCPGNVPSFTVQITFDPLPDQATTKASTAELTSSKGGAK